MPATVIRLIAALAMFGEVVSAQSITPKLLQFTSSTGFGLATQQPNSLSEGEQRPSAKTSVLALLDFLFTSANEFQDEQLKIKTHMRISDLLWKHDEARSRKRFLETYEAIDRMRGRDQTSALQQFVSRVQLRSSLLALIGRHDRKWADRLLEQSLKHEAAEAVPGITTAEQQALERIKVADASMQFDPEATSKMLSRVAEIVDWRGMSGRIFAMTLNNLRKQDAALADDVLLHALVTVQGNPSAEFDSLSNLVECMWPIRKDQNDAQGPAIIRQFLAVAQPIILSRPDNQQPFVTRNDNPLPDWRQMLVAFYDEYTPEVAPMIHKKLNFVPPMDGIHSAWWNSQAENVRSYRDEAVIAVNDSDKDSIYGESARLFANQGNIEDAFAAARSIRNERFRAQVETSVRQYAVEQAAKRHEAHTAYRYAQQEPSQARLDMFNLTIDAALTEKDHEFAMNLLDDIENWLRQRADLRVDPRIWLKLANIGIRVDVDHGFQVMRSAVKAINEAEFNTTEESLKRQSRQQPPRVSIDNLGYTSFGLLARADFPLALALAHDIRKKEVSVLAQLAICEAFLAEPDSSHNKD